MKIKMKRPKIQNVRTSTLLPHVHLAIIPVIHSDTTACYAKQLLDESQYKTLSNFQSNRIVQVAEISELLFSADPC